MMRAIRFNLRQMALVVALVMGLVVALQAGLRALAPLLVLPWLPLLLLIVAIDAVVTQRVVVRERLSMAEQGGLRAVELVLLIVAVRAVSVLGETDALRIIVQPWLRDPLQFFGGRFGEYFIAALFTWILTAVLAAIALNLEVEAPRAGVRSQPNEEAAALYERARALEQFDRMWLFCVALALAGATLALASLPLWAAVRTAATAWPLAGVLMCVVAGLLLHAQGQYDQLAYGWHMEQIDVAGDVPRRWQRASWLLVGVSVVLAVVLAGLVLLAPAPPIVPLLNALLAGLALVLALVVALFGLILLPFAWLLAWFSGGPAPTPPQIMPITPPQIEQGAPERPLVPALIFWACVLILIALAVLRYVGQRQDVRTALGRWRGLRWLLRWLDNVWRDVRQWSALAMATARQRLHRRKPPRVRHAQPGGAQAQLRALYRRLTRSAEARGVKHPPSQTAYELRAALHTVAPPADADVQGLTDTYVYAEYGPRPAHPTDVRRARLHWRHIERILVRTRPAEQGMPAARKKGRLRKNDR